MHDETAQSMAGVIDFVSFQRGSVKYLIAACVLATMLLLAVACGDGGDDNTPSVADSPTAVALDLSKDDLGRSVTPPARAQRIVALSPTVVELMFAVGSTPVGRPSSAEYPEQAKAVANFGTSRAPSFEEIAAMKPDLIIADALLHQQLVDNLQSQLNVPVYAVKVASFSEVVHGLRVVGALTGNKDAGETEAKKLQAKLTDIKAKLPASGPSVLVLVAAGQGQFIASRSNTYLGDILAQLGAKNLVTSEPENFSYPGFTDYSLERIVEKNPDLIITASIGGPPGSPRPPISSRACRPSHPSRQYARVASTR
jgi:iron complex transport system substrate-binding protein